MQCLHSGNCFRIVSTVFLLFLWMLATGSGAAGEFRNWTFGKTTFEAEFVGVEGVAVMLKRKDGKTGNFTLAGFGKEDVRYVEKMSRTAQGEFVDWTDALGNKLKVRYAGVAGQAVMLVTPQGGSMQVPWDRLDARQKAYVIESQQAAVAARPKQVEDARGWKRLENGIQVATLGDMAEAPKGEFDLLRFSHSGELLLSYRHPDDGDNEARIWSVSTPRQKCTIQEAIPSLRINATFTPDEQYVWASEDRWSTSTGRLERANGAIQRAIDTLGFRPFHCACFSPSGKLLAIGGDSRKTADEKGTRQPVVSLLKSDTYQHLEDLVCNDLGGEAVALRFSANGDILVGLSKYYGDNDIRAFHVWNVKSKSYQYFTEDEHGSYAQILADGSFVVVRSKGGMKVFNTATGAEAMTFSLPYGKIERSTPVAISPVGRVVAVGSGDAILLHDWAAGKPLATLSHDGAEVQAIEFSVDGSLLATGDAQGGIKLWKLTDFLNNVNKSDPAATTEPLQRRKPQVVMRQLFDGRTLNGWEADQNANCWSVSDGAIVGRGDHSHLYFNESFTNFRLRSDVRINRQGNGGLYLRASKASHPDGYEVQIAGNGSPKGPSPYTGSLYDISDVKKSLIRDDTWFHLDVSVTGNHITVCIDGQTVLDYIDNLSRYSTGKIALQAWSSNTVIAFKNFEIQELPEQTN